MNNSSCCIQTIMNLLRKIQGSLQCHVQSNAEDLGLTTSQFMIMFEIYHNRDISLIELSEKLDLPKSSVSRIVDQLVNKGIVIREIPSENRRTVKLSISPEFSQDKNVDTINTKLEKSIMGDLEQKKADKIIYALEELSSIIKSSKE